VRPRPSFAVLATLLAAALAPTLHAEEVADGVHLVRGAFVPGRQPDGNSIVLRGPHGVVIVDTGRHVEHTRSVLDLARSLGEPVAIVNTHWHLDHTGGNVLIRREEPGLAVVASRAVVEARTGFLARYRAQLAEMLGRTTDDGMRAVFTAETMLVDAGDAFLPTAAVTASGPQALGGRRLEIHLAGPAVTAGDLWLVDPATRTLITGDLVTLPVPFLDTACPSGWSGALDRLVAADFERAIPGHGPVMTRAQLEAYRSSFNGLLSCGSSARPLEECADAWIAGLGGLLPASEHDFTRQLLGYYVGQVLRGEPARIAELCGD
jgi:glyoxylase-like metal-dependent hydrolase (beta-lactamase superfamily II)